MLTAHGTICMLKDIWHDHMESTCKQSESFYSSSTSSTLGAACACRLLTCPFVAAPVPFVDGDASTGLAFAFPPLSPFFDFLDFFAFLSCPSHKISLTISLIEMEAQAGWWTYLLPSPNRPETVKETYILKEVRIQP